MYKLVTEAGEVLEGKCVYHGQYELRLRFEDRHMAFHAINSDILKLTLANGNNVTVMPQAGSYVMSPPVDVWFSIK